jgi:hypothetical protein
MIVDLSALKVVLKRTQRVRSARVGNQLDPIEPPLMLQRSIMDP